MRDALEQVKSELGEEALVLGSKNLRRRGFLGFGSREIVEVRVSTEFQNAVSTQKKLKAGARKSKFTSLSLNQDETLVADAKPMRNNNAFSALAARAYASESKPSSPNASTEPRLITPIAETAPARTVEVATPTSVVTENANLTARPIETAVPVKRDALLVELERLRAEVREVKFTLSRHSRPANDNVSRLHPSLSVAEDDAAIYDSPYYETYLHLANLGLGPEISRAAVRAAIASGIQTRNIYELARIGLVAILPSQIMFGDDPLAPRINTSGNHAAVALVGPTGVGKTTTIAKLAARAALRERKRVELITLDTYRIAAVEQLRTYAEIIGAGFHVPRSVLELNALVQRFSSEATVLIDTIGRSARDLADQLELADYLRGNDQIVKCLAIQATTHPTDATFAIDKFALFGIDEIVITKLDETGRPGAAICTAAAAQLPLAYLCTGQRVPEDIEKASAETLADYALQPKAAAAAA